MRHRTLKAISAAVSVVALLGSGAAFAQDKGKAAAKAAMPMEQFFPALVYRTGAYAPNGVPFANGYGDYLKLVNARDGGINGVRLTYSECDSQARLSLAVDCYAKLKNQGPTGAALFSFMDPAPAYALLERSAGDKIAIVSLGYGRAAASDGRIFPYTFTLPANAWSQNTASVAFIAFQEQCLARYPPLKGQAKRAVECYRYREHGDLPEQDSTVLTGKKLVNLYLDSEHGRETLPILEAQAGQDGFTLISIPVPAPGIDQKAAWQQIQLQQPDWVILRGWGVMTPIALKEAARIGFPRDRMVGEWWSGAEEDVLPAGIAGEGFIAASLNPSGEEFPALRQIRELLYQNGRGSLADSTRIGTSLYNRGIIQALLNTEAIRAAQAEFGHKPLTGAQVRWGLENLELTPERLRALGLEGMLHPLKITCADHEGGAPVRFQQWDGKEWIWVSGWLEPRRTLAGSLVKKAAADYAQANAIPPRDCSLAGS